MSDLSELIEIAKNIEKQNSEIILLLKKIAKEDEDDALSKYKSLIEYTPDFGELYIDSDKNSEEDESEDEEEIENTFQIGDLLETSIEVGEVYFIEGQDIFKLTVKNNETSIDNLTGDCQPTLFNLQELIANETIKNNASLDDGTVILSAEQSQNLAETLKVCVEQGAKNVHVPLSASTQLISAPQFLMKIIKLNFYKNEDELVEKLFS